jgi:hypothetical protein
MAGQVSGTGGAYCYLQSHTLAVGDWIIAGVWIRSQTGASVNGSDTKFEPLNSGFEVNDGGDNTLTPFLSDRLTADGWRWCCVALKVTAIGSNPTDLRFSLARFGTNGRQFFNPCAILIPNGSDYDDAWIVNYARSLKGGWASTATAGDIAILDHQPFKAGVFKATAKTFATLPSSPVAGMQAYITDCNTATWGAAAAGGGSNKVMVWYNGSNWTVIGK